MEETKNETYETPQLENRNRCRILRQFHALMKAGVKLNVPKVKATASGLRDSAFFNTRAGS